MVIFIKNLDKFVGKLSCRILSQFKKEKKLDKNVINTILVIQLWGIGETILTLPSLVALRKQFPKSKIHVLVTKRNKDVYYKNKDIDELIAIDTNPRSILSFLIKNRSRFDLAIDMEEYLNISSIISFFVGKLTLGYSHGERSKLYDIKVDYNDKQHASKTYADLIRAIGAKFDFRTLVPLVYSDNDAKIMEDYLEFNSVGKFIAIAPGAAESARSRIWPLDNYSRLCDQLIKKYNIKIVFTGSKDENKLIEDVILGMKEKKNAINSAGRFSLTQLFYLLKKAKMFVGNDSGPMHIAAAQGTRTLGLFGPNLPIRFGPYGKGNIGLYKGHNCRLSPCINVHKGQVPDCLYLKSSPDYQKCMKNISIDDVLIEVGKLEAGR